MTIKNMLKNSNKIYYKLNWLSDKFYTAEIAATNYESALEIFEKSHGGYTSHGGYVDKLGGGND